MNYRMIGKTVAQILLLEAVMMIPSAVFAVFDRTDNAFCGFIIGIVILLFVGGLLKFACRNAVKNMRARDGLVSAGLGWIFMSVLGCLPFCISGEIPSFIDALFEMTSGFTTTGATILDNVEGLSRAALYWRSFSHWLGGMGVLVLILAVIPKDEREGGFSLHLLRAESPGPNVGKLMPKLGKTALILYALYVALTVANFFALIACKMPVFDSLCTALGTAGTGGFGLKNDSITSYSPAIQTVCTVFMVLFGVNFNIYYWILLRNFRGILKNEELRFYLGVFAVSSAVLAINGFALFNSVGNAIHHSAFQVAAIMTTTGYATVDINSWPALSKSIILILMVIGASAGSTGGGMKCARVMLLWKNLIRSIKKMIHPQRVQTIRSDGESVKESVSAGTTVYLIAYVFIVGISFLIISADGFTLETNISTVISCFNNIGPVFGYAGAGGSLQDFGVVSKIVLIFDMLAGRLEIFPILVLLSSRTWKRT